MDECENCKAMGFEVVRLRQIALDAPANAWSKARAEVATEVALLTERIKRAEEIAADATALEERAERAEKAWNRMSKRLASARNPISQLKDEKAALVEQIVKLEDARYWLEARVADLHATLDAVAHLADAEHGDPTPDRPLPGTSPASLHTSLLAG